MRDELPRVGNVVHSDDRDIEPEIWRLLYKTNAKSRAFTIRLTDQYYIDGICSGQIGRDWLSGHGRLESLAVLFPLPRISKGCIPAAQLAIVFKLDKANAFANRRPKPKGIKSGSNHQDLSCARHLAPRP